MIVLSDIPCSLDAEALLRRLRIRPGTGNAAAFVELLDWVVAVGRPKALYQVAYIEERAGDSVVVAGVRFTSRMLRKNLDAAERVFPYIITCGTEADAITVPDDDHVQGFWLWTIKEALLDVAVRHFDDHLSARYRLTHRGHMQPGAADADVWPIQQQKELFSLFGDVEGTIGVRLTEAMLMIPTMSVSGIAFPTETDFLSCQVCHREECPRRRAPFDDAAWQTTHGE